MTPKPVTPTREDRETVARMLAGTDWDEDNRHMRRLRHWLETGERTNKDCDRWSRWAQAIAEARAEGRAAGMAELGKVFVADTAKLATAVSGTDSAQFARAVADAAELTAWRKAFIRLHSASAATGYATATWPDEWVSQHAAAIADAEERGAAKSVQWQLDLEKVLNSSHEGIWMARSLDAERELSRALALLRRAKDVLQLGKLRDDEGPQVLLADIRSVLKEHGRV